MANPQWEDGYTKFANELLEAIMRYPFKLHELKVVLKVARDTYGWSRKKSQLSYSDLAKSVGASRRSAIRACQDLIERRVLFIQKTADRRANILGLNKNYEEWLLNPVDNFRAGDTADTRHGDTGDTRKPETSDTPDTSPSDTAVTRTFPDNHVGAILRHTPFASDTAVTTKKPVNTGIKKAGIKTHRPVEKEGSKKTKAEFAKLIDGWEIYIKNPDPRGLVTHLLKHNYDIDETWTAIVQSRNKPDPVGFFVSLMVGRKFPLSDKARETAKEEMRRLNY